MKTTKETKTKIRIVKTLEWLIYMVGYALIIVAMSVVFKNTIQIDNSYFGVWGLLFAVAIYVLNKTIKPIIVSLTLPITALTLGIFYPFINVLILNIVDFVFVNHFTIRGIVMSFIVAILISIMNMIMDNLIIKPILKGDKK